MKGSTSNLVQLLNAGWHPKAGQLLGIFILNFIKKCLKLNLLSPYCVFFSFLDFFLFQIVKGKDVKNVTKMFGHRMVFKTPFRWSKFTAIFLVGFKKRHFLYNSDDRLCCFSLNCCNTLQQNSFASERRQSA